MPLPSSLLRASNSVLKGIRLNEGYLKAMAETSMPNNIRRELLTAYVAAKEAVIKKGFIAEIDWQDRVAFEETDETAFLRESAWVVLSSGMREIVIRKKFPQVSSAFFEWESARQIAKRSKFCQRRALLHFSHEPKIRAITSIAEYVFQEGFNNVRDGILKDGIEYLARFPYIGPATKYHLAKNIGLPAVKPDRHLLRVTQKVGYESPLSMCSDISRMVGDKISVVDLVIWRYATLHDDYLRIFPSRK
jgi:hypothetical protein